MVVLVQLACLFEIADFLEIERNARDQKKRGEVDFARWQKITPLYSRAPTRLCGFRTPWEMTDLNSASMAAGDFDGARLRTIGARFLGEGDLGTHLQPLETVVQDAATMKVNLAP